MFSNRGSNAGVYVKFCCSLAMVSIFGLPNRSALEKEESAMRRLQPMQKEQKR